MLTSFLRARIDDAGPLRLSTFLDHVLYGPHGYYNTKDAIVGAAGDFITAPEISPLFGECIGIALVDFCLSRGCKNIALVELGPGKGTLRSDIQRVFNALLMKRGDFTVTYYGVEICPLFHCHPDVVYVKDIGDIPPHETMLFVANEYFDALPIDVLCEKHQIPQTVTYAADTFRFTHPMTTVIEACPKMIQDACKIALLMAKAQYAYGIFIDYGYVEQPTACTLQAVYRHDKVGIFDYIGQADLSHQVDFKALKHIFDASKHQISSNRHMETHIENMATFLQRYGIVQRLEQLCQQNSHQARDLGYGVARLLGPSAMGHHFKVLNVIT